ETGGNCELTRPGETFVHNGVTIAGPVNLPSLGAIHASEMYARNLFNFLALSLKDGALTLDWDDELIARTCLTHAGEIRHEATRKLVEEMPQWTDSSRSTSSCSQLSWATRSFHGCR